MAKNNNDMYKNLGLSGLDFLTEDFENEEIPEDQSLEDSLMTKAPVEKAKEEMIRISDLVPFRDHPFHVETDDEGFQELVRSIKENGILSPVLVRPLEDKYEIIAGHCRVKAAEMAGLEEVPVICKVMGDYEATVVMVHTNISGRSSISISEKAKAYRMCMDAEKHQGRAGVDTAAIIGGDQDSKRQVYRYVRLSYLIDELLALVDIKKIPVITAIELAYLDEESQTAVNDYIQNFGVLSTDQAALLRKIFEETKEPISFGRIMAEFIKPPKAKPVTKVSFKTKEIAEYFDEGTEPEQMSEVIIMLLSKYRNGDFNEMLGV